MKQEIINLVDKIIGKKGTMRSPAWWVNRIFKKTLDYSDKVTKDVESRANAKIDALEAGKEDKIMTVYVPEILGDTYQPWMTEENKRFYEEVKAGRCHICKIAVNPKGLLDFYMIGSPMWSVEKVYVSALFYWGSSNDLPDVIFRYIVIDSDGDADQIDATSYNLLHRTSLKTINKQSLIGSGNIEIEGEVVDNLESDSTTAALSANQGRVLKEKMVVLRELMQGDSEEIKAYNLETLRLVKENKAAATTGGCLLMYNSTDDVFLYTASNALGMKSSLILGVNADGVVTPVFDRSLNVIIIGEDGWFEKFKVAMSMPAIMHPLLYMWDWNTSVLATIAGDGYYEFFYIEDGHSIRKSKFDSETGEEIEVTTIIEF